MSGNINFNGWLNDDGSENYKCRAWVSFSGNGTLAIRASGNVSSITDNGTGDYYVNFTTAMSDANYSVNILGCPATTTADAASIFNAKATMASSAPTASGFRIRAGYNFYTGSAFGDREFVNVAIFR
jgi:hypothetical protein